MIRAIMGTREIKGIRATTAKGKSTEKTEGERQESHHPPVTKAVWRNPVFSPERQERFE
jgi:hypothetical protein